MTIYSAGESEHMAAKNMVGFIHTTPATITMIEKFMKQYLPLAEFIHMYDGTVKIDNFNSPVGITPKSNLLRFANSAAQLERAGCAVIVSCCSLMPRATAYASAVVDVPFIQLDAVILDQVTENHRRIGVINTTEYIVPYIKEGLEARAAILNKKVEMTFSNNVAALSLFNTGEFEKYEAIVLDDMKKLTEKDIDCIFMGQIPFAMMEDKIKAASFKVPVYYAGETAFKHISDLLGMNAMQNVSVKGGKT